MMSDVRPLPTPLSMQSYVDQTYSLTLQALDLFPSSVQNVWCQFFKLIYDLKPKRLFPRSLTTRERQWSLTCELNRQPGSALATCRPWIVLQTVPVNMRAWSKFKSATVTKVPLMFQWSIGGHLKQGASSTGTENDRASAAMSLLSVEGPMQSFVDGMLEQAAKSVYGRAYAKSDELLNDLKRGLLSSLPRSSLAEAIDFHYLEVACLRKDQRSVSNVMLTADGQVAAERETSATTDAVDIARPFHSQVLPPPSLPLDSSVVDAAVRRYHEENVRSILGSDRNGLLMAKDEYKVL